MNNPAFSTDFSVHKGLLCKFARAAYGRMQQGITPMEYDDIYQEMSVAFVKAAQSWNPEVGVSFTAYMGRSIWNAFNRIASTAETKAAAINTMSDTLVDGESEMSLFDSVDMSLEVSICESPEDQLIRKNESETRYMRLREETRRFVNELANPSEEVFVTLKAMQEHARVAQAQGKSKGARIPKDVSLRVLAKHFAVSARKYEEIRAELRRVYGVEV